MKFQLLLIHFFRKLKFQIHFRKIFFLSLLILFSAIVYCKRSNQNSASRESAVLGRLLVNSKSFDFAKLLNSISINVILPSFAELQTNGENLSTSAKAYQASPTIANLETVRKNYSLLTDSIKRVDGIYSFNTISFPLAAYSNLDLYPGFNLDIVKIEADEINGTSMLNVERVATFGATKRAIQSIEYLLYDNGSGTSDITNNHTLLITNTRRLQLLVSQCADMQNRTKAYNELWKNSMNSDYISGSNSFSSLNDVVGKQINRMVDVLTFIIDAKLGDPAGLSAKSKGIKDLNRLESKFSNRSLEDLQVNFSTIKNIYLGSYKNTIPVLGISDLVILINPNLDKKIKTNIESIETQINSIKSDSITLRSAIQNKFASVQTLHSSFRTLRIILDTELISSLGASREIGNSDGD
jgi:predicted lipoprotein